MMTSRLSLHPITERGKTPYRADALAEAEAARRMIAALAARGELDERHPAVVMARAAIQRAEDGAEEAPRVALAAPEEPGGRL